MDGIPGILIELGARFVLCSAVLYLAARRSEDVVVPKRWATPLIALIFAALSTGAYGALAPILNLATLGALAFAVPFLASLIFLYATTRVVRARGWIEIRTVTAYLWLAALFTAVHGVVWLALEYLPPKL
jgi:hypothetical protein